MHNDKLKVLVVDDHPVVAEGTVALLANEHRISVVGTAQNGEECLKLVNQNLIDVILLDINLPDICGIDLMEKIRVINPTLKIIIFTGQNPEEYITNSMARGAQGFILKDCSGSEMIKGILEVSEGKVYFSPGMGDVLKSVITAEKAESSVINGNNFRNEPTLSPREKEVIQLVSEGLQNKEIADRLNIKNRTVEYHISNILLNLGVSSRLEAALAWKETKTNVG